MRKECTDQGCDEKFKAMEHFRHEMTNPKDGALGQAHEKMNRGFANRPTWRVFLWVIGIMAAVFSGAVGGVYGVSASGDAELRKEANGLKETVSRMVTKEDMQRTEDRLLRAIEDVRKDIRRDGRRGDGEG
jgi:hypothetical protein